MTCERAALQSDTLAQIISGDESCLRDGTLSERQGLYTELLQNGLKTAQRAPLVISARCRYGAEPAVAAGAVHAWCWPRTARPPPPLHARRRRCRCAAAPHSTPPPLVRRNLSPTRDPSFPPKHKRVSKHHSSVGRHNAKMVKQKNHTARNKTVKEHANGIKRVPNFRYKALKHMDAKFYRNLKYSKKWQKGGRPKDESDDEEEEEE